MCSIDVGSGRSSANLNLIIIVPSSLGVILARVKAIPSRLPWMIRVCINVLRLCSTTSSSVPPTVLLLRSFHAATSSANAARIASTASLCGFAGSRNLRAAMCA